VTGRPQSNAAEARAALWLMAQRHPERGGRGQSGEHQDLAGLWPSPAIHLLGAEPL
jgi:hypothetical protein